MALHLIPHGWVILDLEFVGDIGEGCSKCRIWNIGAIKPDNTIFEICIDVPTDMGTHPGCVEVTDSFLRENNAVSFQEGFRQFAEWVGPQAVIMSHNCFKSDKIVLEAECRRHGVELPCWYFYDTLIFLRTKIQCNSYRLVDIYKHVTGKDFNEIHMALHDAKALWEILQILPPDTLFMYPKYLTPLQNIKWVGSACEKRFIGRGVRSIEDLMLNYMQWVQVNGHTVTLMMQFLTQFNLPCHDLEPITKEIVEQWLPNTHGGSAHSRLF